MNKMMFNVNGGGGDDDIELEMLLNEIPQVTYLSHLNQNQRMTNNNNILLMNPTNLPNVVSGSSYSDDDTAYRTRTDFDLDLDLDPRLVKNCNGYMFDQFSLSQTLNKLHIVDDDHHDEYKDFSNPNGFHLFRDNRITHCNVNNEFYGYGRFQSQFSHRYDVVVDDDDDDDDIKLAIGLRDGCYNSQYYNPKQNYLMELAKVHQKGNSNGRIQRSSLFNDASFHHLMNPKHALQMEIENSLYSNNPFLLKQSRAIPSGKIHPSVLSMKDTGDVEGYNCEDRLIIQGNSVKCVVEKGCDRSKFRKKRNEISVQKTQFTYGSLAEVQGSIYFLAKDQQGCRFLQKIFEEGTSQDVQVIFNEIIHHIIELMMDPFGNYLVQKLLDVSSEEQRMLIVIMVTREPGELVKICLNSHGTRVVQKLISTLKMKQQISLIIVSLEPGFIDLIKDVHGNHVVQRCLQCLTKEHTKFIFNAAAKFCVNIATHRHGCCVLNRCIAHSTGTNREKLIAEIAANALLLAQDAFGNYVVQYIIELKILSAALPLLSQFEGHYVHLSMQKFSSHVVEKCLRCCEESRSRIVRELLSVPQFDHLLQHPFSNYVIQSALEVTKGRLHSALVEAVQPHMILRSSPYCKKLFSRNLLKKL